MEKKEERSQVVIMQPPPPPPKQGRGLFGWLGLLLANAPRMDGDYAERKMRERHAHEDRIRRQTQENRDRISRW